MFSYKYRYKTHGGELWVQDTLTYMVREKVSIYIQKWPVIDQICIWTYTRTQIYWYTRKLRTKTCTSHPTYVVRGQNQDSQDLIKKRDKKYLTIDITHNLAWQWMDWIGLHWIGLVLGGSRDQPSARPPSPTLTSTLPIDAWRALWGNHYQYIAMRREENANL